MLLSMQVLQIESIVPPPDPYITLINLSPYWQKEVGSGSLKARDVMVFSSVTTALSSGRLKRLIQSQEEPLALSLSLFFGPFH